MKISIVTICYNNELDILPTVESVVNQTYPDIEYIIVDGGSKDNTLKLVQQYKDNIYKLITEPDRGLYDAINKGIRNATGEIVGLIHAGDQLFDCHVIERIADFFGRETMDAMYANSVVVNDKGKAKRVNISPEYSKRLWEMGWFPSHQSFYARKSLFDEYGYYNLDYRIAADYELLFRFMYIHNIKVKRMNSFVVRFSLGGTSTKNLKSIKKQNQECLDIWKRHHIKYPFYFIPMKILRKIPQIIRSFYY